MSTHVDVGLVQVTALLPGDLIKFGHELYYLVAIRCEGSWSVMHLLHKNGLVVLRWPSHYRVRLVTRVKASR